MIKSAAYVVVSLILCGALTIFIGGCKQQGTAKLTIVVEGRELSDAEVITDGKPAGRLTQTIIRANGKIYIDGMLSATLPDRDNIREGDNYSGCSGTLDLNLGKNTIKLQQKDVQPLQIIINISAGHHLLTVLPEKGLVKWNNTSFQVGPGRAVTIAPEIIK